MSDFAALGGQSKREVADAAAQAKQAKEDAISARELNPNLAAQRDGLAQPPAAQPSGASMRGTVMLLKLA